MSRAFTPLVALALLAAWIANAQPVHALGSATLTPAGPTQGPAGTQVTYQYSSIYSSCAAEAADPKTLQIDLMWDEPAQVIGTAPITANQGTLECDGSVTGTVPPSAAPGPHTVAAYLVDTAKGNQRAAGSDATAATPFVIPGAVSTGGGSAGGVATVDTGARAIPWGWFVMGALAMLNVLLIAGLILFLTRRRRGFG